MQKLESFVVTAQFCSRFCETVWSGKVDPMQTYLIDELLKWPL